MFKTLSNIGKIPELKRKILITAGLLIVYRIGCFVPTPGIDTQALIDYFAKIQEAHNQSFLGMLNMFTGGALQRLSIFALGIMPYISASIIMQLLTAVIPAFEKLAREGRAGYEKINQYTRYFTLALCIFQGFLISKWLENPGSFQGLQVVPNPGLGFEILTILTLGCGTLFIMWLGEQIQERGIGNGISLIITTSIISRIPAAFYQLYVLYSPLDPSSRQISTPKVITLIVLWVAIMMLVVFFTRAQRRIPIQYGRRVVGRKVYGGQNTFLPIKVDMSGVIAIIFAQSVLLFPTTIASFFPQTNSFVAFIGKVFNSSLWPYQLIFIGLIMFFMYFHTALTFNPIETANHLKRQQAFIPGVRPGQKTAEYIDYVATRIVFVGACFVSLIAIFPFFLTKVYQIPSLRGAVMSFFGGTTVLIMVGVVLDTMKQIEGQLLIHHYDGFIKGKKLKGRR